MCDRQSYRSARRLSAYSANFQPTPPMNDTVRSTIQKRDARGVIRHGAEWLTLWSDPDSMKSGAELKREAAEHGTARRLEQQLAAAARAVSANPDMQLTFAGSGAGAFKTLSPGEAADAEVLSALRGEIDSYALVRRYHDASVHRDMAPAQTAFRRLFDMCEEVRCEALGARQFPGVGQNLVASHLRRLRQSDLLNAHLASLIPLIEGLRMVLRDSLLGASDPSIASSGFWMWDRWLRARFDSHLIGLSASMADQAAYAALARGLIEGLVTELGATDGKERRLQPTTSASGDQEKGGNGFDELFENEDGMLEPGGSVLLDDGTREISLLHGRPEDAKAPSYSAFTTAHDLVLHANALADGATLRKERATLEQRRAEFRRDLARLVTQLQRRLLARQTRKWSFDLDDGLIDASRLDRIVVDPGFASAYKQEEESEFRDTVVSILIDNSGSMRGKPIEIACVAADMISTALERCGISCEVLGFTTQAWKGGKSAKDWVRAGRPENPGRLNDTLHIVYKSADEPVRRARLALCAMLDSALLKENIDGEALLWASRRLLMRHESRKVLIVISDGAPVDQTTLEENKDKTLLDHHLRDVVAEIESSGSIELAAIGVKHDVREYYANSARIDNVDALGEALVRMIDELVTR
ncbi:cobaltochelatase CobT [Bradyrhizobium diazoefficiens]|uniref:cobaltochelatase CobT-related protein n=1 Tax=Bradyrhizobium diazoefficiens TaxID=1355477 RepID=UPI0035179BB9